MAATKGTGSPPITKLSVVSCFIIKSPKEGEDGMLKIALFKRSGRANSHHHTWGPIAGAVEKTDASPLVAAWRELREETKLTPASLELMRHGKSYFFADPTVRHEWTIYPFAFRLKTDDSAIQIGLEHESWAWFDPSGVQNGVTFDNMPHLSNCLSRAWFEKDFGTNSGSPGFVLARGLDRLKNDHQSGARQLAGVALGVLRDFMNAARVEMGGDDAWWRQVRFAAWHIWKNGRESMGAAILSVLLDALKSIEISLGKKALCQVRDDAVGDIQQRITRRASSSSVGPVSDALLEYLEKHFPQPEPTGGSTTGAPSRKPLSILTLSESSTIAHFLQQLASRSYFDDIDLRVLESRPLFEGVSLAASLVNFAQSQSQSQPDAAATASLGRTPTKIKVTIYTDASAAMAAEGVDIVLLGADRIASTGAVSNKTGSLPAVLGAKRSTLLGSGDTYMSTSTSDHRATRVVVLGETEKIATPGDLQAHVVEDNDPTQLSRDWLSSFNSQRVRDAAACLYAAASASSGNTSREGGIVVDVQVRNVFFEWVPPELVDAYVTEQGVWTLQDITRHSTALGQEEERVFGGL